MATTFHWFSHGSSSNISLEITSWRSEKQQSRKTKYHGGITFRGHNHCIKQLSLKDITYQKLMNKQPNKDTLNGGQSVSAI